jgi:hypothetical protein
MSRYTRKQSDIEWTLDYLKRLLDAEEAADVKVNRIANLVKELRDELSMDS